MDARRLAIEAIERIIEKQGFTHIVVNEFLKKFVLSDEDKAFFTKLTYGTVENLLTIEYYLEPYIGKRRQKPWIKYLLYSAVYQLVYLELPAYAVVDEAVSIAKLRDRNIANFVNAVLRNFLRNDLREISGFNDIHTLSIKYSYPAWLVSFLLKDYSYVEVEKIFKEYQKVKDIGVRVNTIKTNKLAVIKTLEDEGIDFRISELVDNGLAIKDNIQNNKLLKDGKIIIQDLTAQLVSEVVNPAKNSRVIDLCSAPGGKASHLSSIMDNTGMIVACDIYPHKIRLMEKLFRKSGNINIKTELLDAREVINNYPKASFDYVLADVPCSGLGVMGHKVDLKYQINLKAIEEIKVLQKEILESTWDLVKKDGFYTYSTCTLNKEENELQIQEFTKARDDYEIVYEKTILPFEYGSDGFYICKLRKTK